MITGKRGTRMITGVALFSEIQSFMTPEAGNK